MSFDQAAITRQIRSLGAEMGPRVLEASRALYEPFHEREPYRGVRCTREVAYGHHERNRLDVFEPEPRAPAESCPVLVFVHGGGYVRGDKKIPGSPYLDNVALWAVRHGLVGVNMTYRLAPAHPWPAGAADVAAALAWVREGIGRHGGDPARVYLAGTSAGAVHAASYVSHPEFHLAGGPGIAGAVLLSGFYDLTIPAPERQPDHPYFGGDPARYEARSSLRGLLETPVPLLYVLAELDPTQFERQALHLVNRHCERHGRWPRLVRLMGHNHFTASMHLNTPDHYLGSQLLDFVGLTAAAPIAP